MAPELQPEKPVGDGRYSSLPDDPNGMTCRSLLKKINNIRQQLNEKITEYLFNPGINGGPPLPDMPPFEGAPKWMHRQGHGEIIHEMMSNLERRRKEYRDKCGGDPPPGGSGPAYLPRPVPVPLPNPRIMPRPNTPRSVPAPPVLIPVRPVLPILILPPVCVWAPQLCEQPVIGQSRMSVV